MIPPGQRKFKLRTIQGEDYLNRPKQVCDELQDARKCTHCYQGYIYVAYGIVKGIWDVYRFPCHCSFSGGLEWWQTDDESRYRDRPVEYQCTKEDLPAYVFIHPKHNHSALEKLVKRIVQAKERIQAEYQDAPLPF